MLAKALFIATRLPQICFVKRSGSNVTILGAQFIRTEGLIIHFISFVPFPFSDFLVSFLSSISFFFFCLSVVYSNGLSRHKNTQFTLIFPYTYSLFLFGLVIFCLELLFYLKQHLHLFSFVAFFLQSGSDYCIPHFLNFLSLRLGI